MGKNLGIKVDEGVFRFPEALVSSWVESLDFDHTNLYVVRKQEIYSINGKNFMKHAIYEEGNNQWLLNPDNCKVKKALEGQIKDDNLCVAQEDIRAWRLTAVPLDTAIIGELDGAYWSSTQGNMLKHGVSKGSMWCLPLAECSGPLTGLKDL